jgi:hypothetical protein
MTGKLVLLSAPLITFFSVSRHPLLLFGGGLGVCLSNIVLFSAGIVGFILFCRNKRLIYLFLSLVNFNVLLMTLTYISFAGAFARGC